MIKILERRLAHIYALLFAKPEMADFHYLLLKISLRGLGILNYYDRFVSGENYFVSHILPRLLKNNPPIFFDVGANQGDYSIMLADKFPEAKIFAFEPHPKNYEILGNLKIKNFFPFELALGSTNGQLKLYDYADDDGSTNASLHEGIFNEIYHKGTISHVVNIETLESFTKSRNIESLDLLKIDTEGNEFQVLAGGSSLIGEDRIAVIQFEFNEMNAISHSFFCDFRRLLNNYVFFRLLPKGLLPMPDGLIFTELFAFQNVVAISKSKTHLLKF